MIPPILIIENIRLYTHVFMKDMLAAELSCSLSNGHFHEADRTSVIFAGIEVRVINNNFWQCAQCCFSSTLKRYTHHEEYTTATVPSAANTVNNTIETCQQLQSIVQRKSITACTSTHKFTAA